MTTQVLAALDLAATAVALVALIVLHVLPTGLSLVDNPVSRYGITSYRQGYRALTVAMGVAGLAAAGSVVTRYPAQGRSAIAALLVVFGLCRLAISWWPMDAPGQPRSSRGAIHVALAVGAFLAITIAAHRMQHVVGQLPQLFGEAYGHALAAAFWLLVIGLVGQLVTRRLDAQHRYCGAAERVVYAGIYVLLMATGLRLV
ncbi:MAG: DUF998 domain-containing protein [Acidimicrobiales bacterium]